MPLPETSVITDSVIYLHASSATGSGLSFDMHDLISYDTASGAWAPHFDGSDVGITTGLDAFAQESDGTLLLSICYDDNLPRPGAWAQVLMRAVASSMPVWALITTTAVSTPASAAVACPAKSG